MDSLYRLLIYAGYTFLFLGLFALFLGGGAQGAARGVDYLILLISLILIVVPVILLRRQRKG
jgi:uncharacterized membrane protein YtjA (UPF0391 family)